MRMYQMKGHFKGFPKLVIYHSCLFQRRRNMLSNVQTHYLGLDILERVLYQESYKGKTLKSEIFVIIIFPAFFEPTCFSSFIAARNGGYIALIWIIIQLKAFLTPLLATVSQLKEQFDQRLLK